MADLYNVDIPQGGSGAVNPGSAQFLGMRQELLRQAGLARQAQLDEEQRRKDVLQAEVARENIASQQQLRASESAKNDAATKANDQSQFVLTHDINAPLSDPEKAVAVRLFGPGVVKTQPAQPAMTEGVPSDFAVAPDAAAASEVPITSAKPAQSAFAGTVAQHDSELKKQALQHIIDTAKPGSPIHDGAMLEQAGKTPPAGVVVPKVVKPAAETKSADDLAIEKIYYDQHIAAGMSPAQAKLAARADFNKLQGEEAGKRTNITVTAANQRQEAGFANKSVESDYNDVRSDYTKNVEPILTRAVKVLDTLKTPGGANDVVAIPEFLSAMAGGQGSGLRMTQSELQMIQNARPGTESVWVKLENLANGYRALTPEQRTQMAALVQSVASHQVERGDRYATAMDAISNAKTGVESHAVRTGLMKTDLSDARSSLGLPANPKDETPEQRRARIRAAAGL